MSDDPLAAFVDSLPRAAGSASGDTPERPEATLERALEREPEAVADRLRALVADVDEQPPAEQKRTVRTVYAVVDASYEEDAGGYAPIARVGNRVVGALPEATLDVCEAIVGLADGDGDQSVYARAVCRRLDVDELPIAERLGDPASRAAVLGLCARGALPSDAESGVVDVLRDDAAPDALRVDAARAIDYGRPKYYSGSAGALEAGNRERLVAALDDPSPRVRAHVAAALAKSVHGECGRDGPFPEWVGELVVAVAVLLTCDDEQARRRTAWTVESHEGLFGSEALADALSPGASVTLGVELLDLDRHALPPDLADWWRPTHWAHLFTDDAVWRQWESVVSHGWVREPRSDVARAVAVRAAEARPDDVPAADLERFVEAVRDGPREHDVRILTATARSRPEAVVDAVQALIEAAESESGTVRRSAIEALAAVREQRPGDVPAEHDDLLDWLGPVVDGASVDVTRFLTLAAVAPDEATATLIELSDRDAAVESSDFGRLVERLAANRPAVVADAAAPVGRAVCALPRSDRRRPLSALATLAAERPSAVAPAATSVATLVADDRERVRAAAATLLYHVGQHDESALPDWTRPLATLSPEEGAETAAWPLGVLASAHPEHVTALVVERLVGDESASPRSLRHVRGTVAEVAAGDETAVRDVVAEVADVVFEVWADSQRLRPARVLEAVVEECPIVAPAVVEPAVRARAEGSGAPRQIDALLATLSSHAPDEFRAAINAEFGGPDAFVAMEDGRPDARATAAEAVYDSYEASRFLGVPDDQRFGLYEGSLHEGLLKLEEAVPDVETGLPAHRDDLTLSAVFDALQTIDHATVEEHHEELGTTQRAVVDTAIDLGYDRWTALSKDEIDAAVDEPFRESIDMPLQASAHANHTRRSIGDRIAYESGRLVGRFAPDWLRRRLLGVLEASLEDDADDGKNDADGDDRTADD